MKNDTKFFGCVMLLLSFSLCWQPCVQGQEKIVSDNSKWKVSWQMFSGRPDPSYLLNDDEINRVKEIISRKVTRVNEIVVAPDVGCLHFRIPVLPAARRPHCLIPRYSALR